MLEIDPIQYARDTFSRPPLKHQRYSLDLEDHSPDGIYVRATPVAGAGYIFNNPQEDSRFNLSSWLRSEEASKLELSGFELTDNIVQVDQRSGERYLHGKLRRGQKDSSSFRDHMLNLDKYLDMFESYDEVSGEFKAKFGRNLKRPTSQRSIILCFDGTSNQFSNQNTNVVKLMELLKKDDPEQQMVYYQPGIGTYTRPGFLTTAGQKLAATADEALALQITDGYRYLMETYRAGDQIIIFGFSRGAYTARALAGMLHEVGLLPRHNMEQISFAYQIYKCSPGFVGDSEPSSRSTRKDKFSTSPEDLNPTTFMRAFCIPVTITFLGVWDTVASINPIPLGEGILPWIVYNPSVKHFRQALALDENRGNFIPHGWNHQVRAHGQSAVEVWFKGGHTDIGGGAPPAGDDFEETDDPVPARLSNISLRWMVQQCLAISEARVLFNPFAIAVYRDKGILEKRPAGVSKEELQNAINKLDQQDVIQQPYLMHAQKTLKGWGWWILDKLPVPKLSQTTQLEGEPSFTHTPNNGAARIVNCSGPKGADNIRLHASVYTHLKNIAREGKKEYIPAALWYNWEQNKWPVIEDGGGTTSGISVDNDDLSVGDALNMSWNTKQNEGWFNVGRWFK